MMMPNSQEIRDVSYSKRTYLDRVREQRLLPDSYVLPLDYLSRWKAERRDITKFLPFMLVHTFPRQGNERLYGFTLRNKPGTIHRREDLYGENKVNTDIHERTHRPDELETRYVTDWKMEWMFPKEEKYRTKPKEYEM